MLHPFATYAFSALLVLSWRQNLIYMQRNNCIYSCSNHIIFLPKKRAPQKTRKRYLKEKAVSPSLAKVHAPSFCGTQFP